MIAVLRIQMRLRLDYLKYRSWIKQPASTGCKFDHGHPLPRYSIRPICDSSIAFTHDMQDVIRSLKANEGNRLKPQVPRILSTSNISSLFSSIGNFINELWLHMKMSRNLLRFRFPICPAQDIQSASHEYIRSCSDILIFFLYLFKFN